MGSIGSNHDLMPAESWASLSRPYPEPCCLPGRDGSGGRGWGCPSGTEGWTAGKEAPQRMVQLGCANQSLRHQSAV